jgi:hypothetical protein
MVRFWTVNVTPVFTEKTSTPVFGAGVGVAFGAGVGVAFTEKTPTLPPLIVISPVIRLPPSMVVSAEIVLVRDGDRDRAKAAHEGHQAATREGSVESRFRATGRRARADHTSRSRRVCAGEQKHGGDECESKS